MRFGLTLGVKRFINTLLHNVTNLLGAVLSGAWFLCGVARHHVTAGHAVQRCAILVAAGVSRVVCAGPRSLCKKSRRS